MCVCMCRFVIVVVLSVVVAMVCLGRFINHFSFFVQSLLSVRKCLDLSNLWEFCMKCDENIGLILRLLKEDLHFNTGTLTLMLLD